MNKTFHGAALGLLIPAVACTAKLSEQNHPCPCASQWTCCDAANVCVPEGTACPTADSGVSSIPAADGAPDAPTSVSPLDATPIDQIRDTDSSDGSSFTTGRIDIDASLGGLCTPVTATAPDAGPDAAATDAGTPMACPCTRRPGAGNTLECPMGLGEYVSWTIGPSGGPVALQGRQGLASGVAAEFDFPPTAIATPTEIKLIETSIPPPPDLIDWSPVYLVEPAGLALTARTPFHLPDQNVALGPSAGGVAVSTSPTGLSVWFSPDGACFTPVADSYVNAGFMMGSTTQLGYFIVGVPRTAVTATCP
jgi:hypothetical protein